MLISITSPIEYGLSIWGGNGPIDPSHPNPSAQTLVPH